MSLHPYLRAITIWIGAVVVVLVPILQVWPSPVKVVALGLFTPSPLERSADSSAERALRLPASALSRGVITIPDREIPVSEPLPTFNTHPDSFKIDTICSEIWPISSPASFNTNTSIAWPVNGFNSTINSFCWARVKCRGFIRSWTSNKSFSAFAARSCCLANARSMVCCRVLASSSLMSAILSFTSSNFLASVIDLRVETTTAAAAMAATTKVQIIIVFHQSTERLKSCARRVRDWSSDIGPPSEVVAFSIVFLSCCVMVGVALHQTLLYYRKYCNTKIPIDKPQLLYYSNSHRENAHGKHPKH